jgi:hypothetical protein
VIDPEAAAVITPHLLVGEELLWCGRPHDTAALRGRAAVIVLVGCAALVLRALPLDSGLTESADANAILLAMLVCALIAEAIVFHTYLSNTFYGVTNQRVLIVSGLRELRVAAAFLEKLNSPMLRLIRIGNILELHPAHPEYSRGAPHLPFQNPSVLTRYESYRLVGLENARTVYRIILDAVDKL